MLGLLCIYPQTGQLPALRPPSGFSGSIRPQTSRSERRRGRILRNHKDKPFAYIHDLVVAPIINSSSESYTMERSLLQSELRRVRDFASLSENADVAYSELENIVDYYNLSIL